MTAKSNNQTLEAFTAGADLSAVQHHFMKLSAADTVTLAGSLGDLNVAGVLVNNPQSGEAATVCMNGMVPVVCGSSIAVNALITVSASGRAITSAPASGTSQMVVGRVLEASGADGDIVTAWVHQPWRYTNPNF